MKRTKSKKPRKQRKFLYRADLHLRRKRLAANLSKELRKQFRRRSFPLRVGDEVKIMRGKFAGKTSKVSKVDLKNYKVYLEGLKKKRTVGTEYLVPFSPSNLQIVNLELKDELRKKALGRGK